LVVSICVIRVWAGENVDFDPFGFESQQSDAVSKELSVGPMIPQVEFGDNDISMAFQIISDATGWSIYPTAEVSRAKISLWAKNVSAGELHDTIVKLTGFIYHRENDSIFPGVFFALDPFFPLHGALLSSPIALHLEGV